MNSELQPPGSDSAQALGHEPYANGLELLAHLMARLDARLASLVEEFQAVRGAQENHPFHGLVITHAEIDGLLGRTGGRTSSYEEGSLWQQVEPRIVATRRTSVPLPLEIVRERFRLSAFETECLLMCYAAEIDSRYQKVFGYLNDDVTRKYPTAQLLLSALCPADTVGSRRRLLLPSAPLLRGGLLNAVDDGGAPSPFGRCLRVEPAIVQFLLEDFQVDSDLQPVWLDREFPLIADELWTGGEDVSIEEILRSHFEMPSATRDRLVVALAGRWGSGRSHAAAASCARLGLGLLTIDCRRVLRQRQPDALIAKAFRDSLLHGAPLLLAHFEAVLDDREHGPEVRLALERNIEDHGWIVFLSVERENSLHGWFARHRLSEISFRQLSRAERHERWMHLLTSRARLAPAAAGPIADALSAKFRLTAGQAALVFQRAAQSPTGGAPQDGWSTWLHRHAAQISAPRLGELAQKLTPLYRWHHLVLPAHQIEQVRFIASHVQHRRKVMEEWRFETLRSRGKGLAVLFSGPPGTGKTMAAEVVANELQMDLYQIDLAGVVSKYIGETEKNLARIFHEAEHSDAILFFDEADALFGKRSEVKDAHDRYANIEINYLLQRIESYEGLAILATNLRQHLDDAFLRRIQIVVEFPMPSVEHRLLIWRQSFPPQAPLSSDVDFQFLAQTFDFSGGNVANVSLSAALLAAEHGGPIAMEHIIRATRRELEKVGKRSVREEFGRYSSFLEHSDASAAAG
jgi:hypothetical protein